MTRATASSANVDRMLVVAPHATRSGSTRVLLDLLAHLQDHIDLELAVEVRSPGPLSAELERSGRPLAEGEVPVLVLANTALAADALLDRPSGVATAVYLHESGEVLATLPERAAAGVRAAHLVVCVSDAIAQDAVGFGVDPERILVAPPVVAPRPTPSADAIDEARRAAGVTSGQRLVLGCGEARWAKGADLFVALAGNLAGDPHLNFAWVGRRLRSFTRLLDHDVASLGLTDRLTWVGDVDDASPFLAAADLVVMPSRDDSQPLVPLEAAQVGTPTVAFDIGGLSDLGAAGAAAVAAYPDVPALAQLARSVLDDGPWGQRLVQAGRERIDRLQAPEVVGPRFVRGLESLLANAPVDS